MTSGYMRSLGEALIARADGATVQGEFGGGEWQDLRDDELYHLLKDGDCDVRVKPAPAFRPFKDGEELVAEYCRRFGVERKAWELPAVWVKDGGTCRFLIHSVDINAVALECESVSFDSLAAGYTFLDGSPCGVEEG